MLTPSPHSAPDAPTQPFAPKIGGVNPALREKVNRLVAEFPEQSLRVVREWMAQGDRLH